MTITTAPELNVRISELYGGAENLRKIGAQAKYKITVKDKTNLTLQEATVISAFIDKYEVGLYQLKDFVSTIGSHSKDFAAPNRTGVLSVLNVHFNKNITYFRLEAERLIKNNKDLKLNSQIITDLAERFALISKKLTELQDAVFGGPSTNNKILILTAADLISRLERQVLENLIFIELKINDSLI